MSDHVSLLADDYLHDLLPPEAQRAFEAHVAQCEACAASLAEARARLEALRALPPVEPSHDLVERTLAGVEADKRAPRLLPRLFWGAVGSVAAAALFLIAVQWHAAGLRASGPDLAVLGQDRLIASSRAVLRVRLHDQGRPMSGVPVSIDLLAPDGREERLADVKTDDEGDAAPRVELPDWPQGDYRLKVRGAGETVIRRIALTRPFRVMLSSDKPIYQPGQTVHLRALALRVVDLKPLAGEKAVLRLLDPRGNVVFKHEAAASRFGIVAADCPLAAEIDEGAYTVSCDIGGTTSRLTVEVKRYVLPKFTVEVTPDRPYYAPGQRATVRVRAIYTFGKPLAGAAVEAALMTDILGEPPLTAKATTDDNGLSSIAFDIPATADDKVRLGATVTDTAGQAQTRAVTRPVTASPYRIDILPEAGTLVPGVPNIVHVLARRIDGQPLAKARLALAGQGVPASVTTDEQGTASFTMVPQEGSSPLAVVVLDAGGMVLATRNVDLQAGHADFLVRPSKSVCKAGETLRIAVLGSDNSPVFLDVLRAGQTVLSATVTPEKGRGELALDLPPDLVGTLRLVAYRLDSEGIAQQRERLIHVRPADGLLVRAELDQEEYRPGKEATLRLSLIDDKGRPTPGAVSLSAVDEAVYAVQAQRPGMEQQFYALERELLKPVYAIYPWTPDEPSARRDQALFAAASRGTGQDTVHSLASRTFPAKEEAVRRLQLQRLNLVRGGWEWLAVLALLVGYGGLWLWLPVRWMLIGSGIVLPGMCCLSFVPGLGQMNPGPAASKEAMRFAGGGGPLPTMADGLDAPRVRTFFPETLLWKPELVSDDAGKFPPLSFPVADSITTYRLTASAVSADGRLGASVQPLKVFQPFFADMDLPPFLTRGDEASVPVAVYSYLGAPQTVTLKLEAGDGFVLLGKAEQTLELGKNEVRSVRFPLRVVKAGRHKLKVTARAGAVADAIERTVTVDPGGRRIEATHNGTLDGPTTLVFDVPADAIEGSVRGLVKVYPSPFSQLVEGLEGIFRLPHGCFEQTSSTTYPNVLALSYLKRKGIVAPAIEAKARQYIHLGYQRLLAFEVPGGGFDWYGRPPADVRLTAYGLMEFMDMATVHDVDPRLIERTRAWLLSHRNPDGSWHGDVAATAYAAWAVFAEGKSAPRAEPTRRFLLSKEPASLKDPNTLALVCQALSAIDPKMPELPACLDALAALRTDEGDGKASWDRRPGERTLFYGRGHAGKAETTALAAQAFLAGKRHAQARSALRWLASAKDSSGTWGSTQSTVQALKALVAGTTAPAKEAERVVEVTVNGQSETVRIPADQAEVLKRVNLTPRLKAGRNTVSLAAKTPTAFQAVFRHNVPEPKKKEEKGPLSLALSYDRTRLSVGGTVKATMRATNNTKDELPMVMLDLPIPPGFDTVRDDFDALVAKGTIARYQTTPRFVIVYLRALKPGVLEIGYRLRSRMAMKAESRGARVYEYYAPQVEARTEPQRFEVDS